MRNKEKQRAYSRAWYWKNRDRILAKRREWYLSHVEEANTVVYQWIKENPEARARHNKTYWEKRKLRRNK